MVASERKLVSFPEDPRSFELRSHPQQPSLTLVEAVHGEEVALQLVEPQSADNLR
jgi:hypothetical protein